jgi:hypothetical protein
MTDICYRKNEGGRSVKGGRLAAPVRPPLSDLQPQLCREELHSFILREEGAGFAIANFTDHNLELFLLRILTCAAKCRINISLADISTTYGGHPLQ